MFSCQFFRLSGAEYGIWASRTPGFDESGECTAGRALFEYLAVVDVSAGNAFDFRVEQVRYTEQSAYVGHYSTI